MAYTPANDFDASPCGYEVPSRLEADFDRVCLPGSTSLNLCGPTGVTTLNLGCYSEPAEEPAEDVEVTVGSQTRKPTAAVGISKPRDATISARTRTPTLLAIVGKVTRTDVAARTRTPTLTARVVPVPKVTVGAATRRPRLNADLAYDPNLLSDVVALTTETWRAGDRVPHSAAEAWQERLPSFGAGIGAWSPAQALSGPAVPSWRGSERVAGDGFGRWRAAGSALGGARDGWLQAPREIRFSFDRWREGLRLDGQGQGQWHPGPPHYHEADRSPDPPNNFHAITLAGYPPHRLEVDFPGVYAWAARKGRGLGRRDGWRDAGRELYGFATCHTDGDKLADALIQCWRDATLVPYWLRAEPPPPPPPPWARDWGNNLCLIQPLGLPLDLGFYGCGWTPEPGTPGFIIPLRVAYLMHHIAALYRIDPVTLAETRLPFESFSVQSRFTDTVRRLSASLFGSHVAPLLDSTTAPIALRAEVNGIAFIGEVDTYQEDAAWQNGAGHRRSVSVTAYSPTFRLGGKWRTPRTHIETNARTMAQLAEQELADTGFTVTWNAIDWLVPAGTWSYSNLTPIQAIAALAASAGAYIISDKVNQSLRVEPVYHVLPWDYGTATPDIVIPRAAIERWTKRNPIPQQANGVWIGSDIQNPTLYHVVIEGTDGSLQTDDVRDPLMVSEAAVRARGERIIGALQPPPLVSQFTIPVDNVDFPLFELGQLIEVQDMPGGHVRGIVRGVDLSVSKSENDGLMVRQTITLGEEPTNTYQRLSALIRPNPILLGTVTSVSGDVAQISTSNAGAVIAMTGAFSVSNGDRVWAQDRGRGLEIVGSAPSYGAGILIEI